MIDFLEQVKIYAFVTDQKGIGESSLQKIRDGLHLIIVI